MAGRRGWGGDNPATPQGIYLVMAGRRGWGGDNPATPQGIYLVWGRQTRMGRGQPSYAAGYLFSVGPADADGAGTTQLRRRVFI